MDVKRKCVTLQTTNIKYIESLCKMQKIKSFSKTLNQVIEERRINEKFDSCQNEF